MENSIDITQLAKSSRRSALASLFGIAIVIASLAYSGYTLKELNKEREALSRQNTILQDSIAVKQSEVQRLEEQLSLTLALAQKRYEMQWSDAKALASSYETYKLIHDLLGYRNRNVSWKLGGTSPETGFDSPGFAAYVLSQRKTIPPVEFSQRYKLREIIPSTSNPKPGDLIFYDTGYTMFYLKDRSGQPFCIGMTPMGIVALHVDFGPRLLGYGRIDYKE